MDDKSVHVKFCLYFYNQFFVSENMIIFLECIKFFGGDFRRGGGWVWVFSKANFCAFQKSNQLTYSQFIQD